MLKELFQFAHLQLGDVRGVVVSSVVPPLDFAIERMCQRHLNLSPLWVNAKTKTSIKIKLDNPRELGADRIVNAVAGFEKYGGPLIIVDFGTATTFDYISSRGEYRGGMTPPARHLERGLRGPKLPTSRSSARNTPLEKTRSKACRRESIMAISGWWMRSCGA